VSKREPDLDRVIQGTLLGDGALAAEVAMLLADERGFYVAVNDDACELTGYARAALVSFRAGELAADEASRAIYDKLMNRRKLRGRKLVRRADGRVVQCRYWGIPTTVARLPYFVVLLWPVGEPQDEPAALAA
jgi:PAS domain S-box-containing protein